MFSLHFITNVAENPLALAMGMKAISQKKLLSQTFGCVRHVWNNVLAWRSEEYRVNQTKINYSDTSAYLTAFKKEHPFLNDVSSVALQQALRNQEKAS